MIEPIFERIMHGEDARHVAHDLVDLFVGRLLCVDAVLQIHDARRNKTPIAGTGFIVGERTRFQCEPRGAAASSSGRRSTCEYNSLKPKVSGLDSLRPANI